MVENQKNWEEKKKTIPFFFLIMSLEKKTILFYGHTNLYGEFSNFYPSPIILQEKTYPTVEHYFQSMKFMDEKYKEQIQQAKNPTLAKQLGQSRNIPLRADWEQIKDQIMYEGLMAKFTQLPHLKQKLLETGNYFLIENAPSDYYWGCGRNGKGKNKLGQLLMRVRKEIQESFQK